MVRKLILALIALAGTFALLWTDQYFRQNQHDQEINEIENSKRALFERLTQDLQERISVIEDIRAFLVSQKGRPDPARFSNYVQIMVRNHPGIDGIYLLDVDTRKAESITHESRALVGKLTGNLAHYEASLNDALENEKTSLTDPVKAPDGMSHIIAWVPLQREHAHRKLLVGLFEVSTLLKDLPFTSDPRMQISLRDRHGKVFWGEPIKGGSSVPTIIPFGDNHWILDMDWRHAPPGIGIYILVLIWGVGGALLLSLMFIVNRIWSRQERLVHAVDEKTVELKLANEQLRKEIEVRKVSEQALQETEQRFRATFDQAAVGIAQVNTAGVFTRVNRKLCEILGYSEDELTGSSVENFAHGNDRETDLINLQRILSGDIASYEMVKRYIHKNGDIIWVNLSVSLVKDSRNLPRYFVMVMEDISLRIKAEEVAKLRQEELTHAARLATMGEMASGLAHEINQPLSAIVNYSSGCLRRMSNGNLSEQENREVMRLISHQAERAAEIMKRLRNFVRKTEPVRSEIAIPGLIENVKRFVDAEARSGGISIHVDIERDLPDVYVDAIQVEQVLLNLVRNALDAMLKPTIYRRQLFIRACTSGEAQVLVSIRDTGVGIPDDLRDQVFDPFVSTKSSGTGLGLSISQSLVEAHGGKLWVEPAEDGEGMVFLFHLPVRQRFS